MPAAGGWRPARHRINKQGFRSSRISFLLELLNSVITGEDPLLGEAASVAAQIYALVHDAAESVRKVAGNLQEGQSPGDYSWSDELTAKLELLSDEFPELCEEFWFRSLFGEITLRLYSFASDALEICVDPESGPEDSPELYSAWLSLYQRTEGLLKTFQYGDLL